MEGKMDEDEDEYEDRDQNKSGRAREWINGKRSPYPLSIVLCSSRSICSNLPRQPYLASFLSSRFTQLKLTNPKNFRWRLIHTYRQLLSK